MTRSVAPLVLGLCISSGFFRAAAGDQGSGPLGSTVQPANNGIVHLQGRSLADENGPFLGLGASYFLALRDAKFDRAQLENNLSFLAARGFNYVRVFCMVSWEGLEIAPVAFTNRLGHSIAAWADYWQNFDDLLRTAGEHHLRLELTVFADARFVVPTQSGREAFLQQLLDHIAGRERQLMYIEVANEGWQNGFAGTEGAVELRRLTRYLVDRTPVLVAITSPSDISESGITALHRDSAATVATVHFSRDTRTIEGGWLPVRDSFRAGVLDGVPPVISNEPIGPGSSVNSETDPIKLCSAAAFAYIANLPAYVFHSRAGIRGFEQCCPPSGERLEFEKMPGVDAFRFLARLLPPDLANWKRNDGLEPSSLLTVFCNGKANSYWPGVEGALDGCLRNIGSGTSNMFVCLPIGILPGGLTLQARRPLSCQVFDPLSGVTVTNLNLKQGDKCMLAQGPGAYLIKGVIRDDSNSKTSQAPYPASALISHIEWHWDTLVTAAPGSDLWPVTWGPDDNLYAAWGDGGGFGGTDSDGRVALGFARLEGTPEHWRGTNINGGKNPENPASFRLKGKTTGIACVDGTLYATINLQDAPWPDVTHALIWSTNKGATWTLANWRFPKGPGQFQPAKFVSFGKDYSGLPSALRGYLYLCGPKQSADPGSGHRLYLARVPRKQLRDPTAYTFFYGLNRNGKSTWGPEIARAEPVFSDANGVTPGAILYVPALKRFLLTCFHTGPGQLGVFEAPEMWGTWKTIAYYEAWGDMGTEGEGLTCGFIPKWTSPDGRTFWAIFSVYGEGAKMGINAHDSFNLIKVSLDTDHDKNLR